jgi:hypothetical protein
MLVVRTFSGYLATQGDPSGSTLVLGADALDAVVGDAVTECLFASRFIESKEEWREFAANREQAYEDFVHMLMAAGNYGSRRELFKAMASCSIEQTGSHITIRPTRHRKLEAWNGEGFTDADSVVVRADAPPDEIGAALREAFRRCI